MDLMPHNLAAYKAVKKHLRKSNRTCVIHPTGTGKSYIALQLIEDKPKARILYITSVATNLLEFWDKVEGLGGRRMVLSLSQSSIPKVVGGDFKGSLDGAPVDIVSDFDEDDDSEVGRMTDEERQRMLMKAGEVDESYLKGPVVQFCLYAGLDNLLPNFDLIIVDEFHRAGAPRWEKQVRRILDDNADAKVVGFSATPSRMDGKDMRSLFDNDIASQMKLSSTIAGGLLPLPHYWLGRIKIDDPDENKESDNKDKKPDKGLRKKGYPTLAKRHLEAGSGLREAFKEALIPEGAEHGKFIVFCRTIRNTRILLRASEEWFDWVDEVHRYEMHSQDRNGFSEFVKDDSDCLRLLFVVDMLTEGVHMEDLDGVIMIRPTESERVYFQQLGRALAVTTQREHPIVFDLVSNAGVMKGGMDFWKEVGKDMELEERDMEKFFHITAEAADFIAYVEETEYDYYGAMKAFYEEYGHLYIPPGYSVGDHDVYKEFCRIRNNRGHLSAEYKKKYEDIGMDWEITYQWMKGFWAAEEYFKEHGDIDVPSTTGEYHGVWLYDYLKRNREKQDLMCERQRMMLDSIGMDWTIIDPWEERFRELVAYKEENGHCDVPGDHGALGKWVYAQRENPPAGDKRERLDELGFEWDGRKSRSRNSWRAGVAHSTPFYKEHGHLKVPSGYVCSDGYKLGNFIKNTKRDGRLDELENACIKAE